MRFVCKSLLLNSINVYLCKYIYIQLTPLNRVTVHRLKINNTVYLICLFQIKAWQEENSFSTK